MYCHEKVKSRGVKDPLSNTSRNSLVKNFIALQLITSMIK